MSKKTRLITYNLADRDRKHTGQDRSNMNIQSAINRINAEDTQELVNSGDMYGYYGHELRGRFGMNPPDVWVNPNTSESIRIEPALRTTKLSADNDGNVTAQHEFLDTDTGKYSERLYSNNAGGFSSAVMRKMGKDGLFDVTSWNGYDYVRQPNYNTNRGDGLFDALFIECDDAEMSFDSLEGITPQRAVLKAALETAILHQYDSIEAAIQADQMISHYQNESLAAQDAYINKQERLEIIRAKRASREQEIFDGLICPSVPFAEMAATWNSFDSLGTSDRDLVTTESVKQKSIKQKQQRQDRVSVFNRR